MLKVRICESYPNWYWNSMTGVTLRKDNREGIEIDEENEDVKMALEQGILEIIPENEEVKKEEPTPELPVENQQKPEEIKKEGGE